MSVGEFAAALEKVLRSFGLSVYADSESGTVETAATADPDSAPKPRVVESHLPDLATNAAAEGFELLFIPQLRQELQRQLTHSPKVVRFFGLRDCVKQLAGSPRWNHRCQTLNDQIVDYLRSCWKSETASQSCALVVQ